MTLALGIDPGTATTGYGLVRRLPDGGLRAEAYGVISTPKDDRPGQRLARLYDELGALLLRHPPDSAAVEKLFFQRNVSTAILVGQARGVILLALARSGVETFEYTPNEVKLAVTSSGSAGKRQVQEMVRALLGLKELPRPDDASDALAVAITHLHSSPAFRIPPEGSK